MFSNEFDKNRVLQMALATLNFAYFIVFYSWINHNSITRTALESGSYICPRYLQSCEWWYVMEALPVGYSQTFIYMLFFGLMIWVVYLLIERRWREAQLSLIPLFIWHTFTVFVFSDIYTGNYEYYLFVFGIVLLFLPHKEFFLKLSLVIFYVLSTVAKIHPSWVEGGYFTAMRTGLPLFPYWSIPIFTNLVIVMEMVGAWFLLSKNPYLQRTAFAFFVIFHLYSGILVSYRYPATVLPMILVVFGPWYRYTPPPFDRKAVAGWVLIFTLCFMQFVPRLIPGDEKMTLEGNKYGLYMFEANHQCITKTMTIFENGKIDNRTVIGTSARDRCDIYSSWFRFNTRCERDPSIIRIGVTHDHSINGGPFYRIVDVDNICTVNYKPFSHNEWISTQETAPIIGYPVKNYYY